MALRSAFVRLAPLLALALALASPAAAEETQQDAASHTRWLVSNLRWGSMATQNVALPGYAFASEEDFAESGYMAGAPRWILPDMSQAHQNLLSNPLGSFSVARENCSCKANCADMPFDVLVCERATISGNFSLVQGVQFKWPTDNKDLLSYVAAHPAFKDYLTEGTAHTWYMWEMNITQIYYTGGYGSIHYIGDIPVTMYYDAKPTPPP